MTIFTSQSETFMCMEGEFWRSLEEVSYTD